MARDIESQITDSRVLRSVQCDLAERQGKPRFGFNVIGCVSSNVGIGASARNIIRLLLAKEYPVAILDLDAGRGRSGRDLSLKDYFVTSPEELPYAVNLSVLSLASISDFFHQIPDSLFDSDRLNVGCFWWELPVIPKKWIESLQFFDVLLAGSQFICSTFESRLSNVFTLFFRHPFYLPEDIQASRSNFELPRNCVVFGTICEPSSDFERKNPFAAIQAFKRIAAECPDAHLAVRINNASLADQHPALSRMRKECAGDSRIHLIERPLMYNDVLSLYASCDVFVALHRAEGLGFGLMETMTLGKPVIATGWSGNMTFMNHTNSCLVNYKLVPVQGSVTAYDRRLIGKDALWAEPDIETAAAWMKRLVDDPNLRLRIGNKAANDMAVFQERAAQGQFIEELSNILSERDIFDRNLETRRLNVMRYRSHLNNGRFSAPKRVARNVSRLLDRHILWRFRESHFPK